MKFIAIIPARYASSRFPGKPLALIDGKPMVRHVYERVSRCFDSCYVATDDERIADAVEGFGGRFVMTSAGHNSGTDRCAEALGNIENSTGVKYDVVINVQGDEPFVSGEHLSAVSSVFENPETQIATLVKKFAEGEDIFNPNTPKVVISAAGKALYFSRSVIPYIRGEEQSEWVDKNVFYKHIGLYAYRHDILREITRLPAGKLEKAESLEQLRWLEHGYDIEVREVASENLSVDTPEDLLKLKNAGIR